MRGWVGGTHVIGPHFSDLPHVDVSVPRERVLGSNLAQIAS